MATVEDGDEPPRAQDATVGLIGPGDLWYKDAIIYSLNVETFQDSDGDGIGDFRGLTSRIDYLHALGITCIWLQPFYPSPGRDNRYDVADYYGVDPVLGNLGDFVDFLRVARERGIRVMIDLVVNHTSDSHPWFVAARNDPASRYRDYYVWAETPPADADTGMMFPGVEKSTWTWDEVGGAHFFHRFYRHQPDLNLGNPAVRDEIRKIIGFWLELGVSGFRVDAAPFLIERKGILPARMERRRPHTFFRYMRGFLSWRRGDAALLAEANVPMDEVEEYVGSGDKLHMLFSFYVNQHLFLSLATQDVRPLEDALRTQSVLPATSQWANFLRNHDELDLSQLSPEQREQVYAAFAPDPGMQLYGRGIRRRLAALLGHDRALRELAHSLMLAIAGTPVLYYGDEIGMGDDLQLCERECVRTPMQWSATPGAGFSTADGERLVRPVLATGPGSPEMANVADQQRDPNSFLNWLRRALGVRKTCRELSWGTTEVLDVDDSSICALRCGWRGETLITVHNLSPEAREITLPPGTLGDRDSDVTEMLSDREYERREPGAHQLQLAGYGYRWLRLRSSTPG